MKFRWIALLSLWTLLIGPVVALPPDRGPVRTAQAQAKQTQAKNKPAKEVIAKPR